MYRNFLLGMALVGTILALSSCLSMDRPAPLAPGVLRTQLPDSATPALQQMLMDYYTLKEALVMDRGNDARQAAQAMVEKGHQVQLALGDTLGLSPKEDLFQARLFIDTLTTAGLQIAEQSTEELEWMRYHFAQVSEVMHRLLLASGWEGVPVYVQYCPMAFNDHGAYWLSADAEIRNPYFGRLLKECGEVLDTIH